jgi:hypothetical protein
MKLLLEDVASFLDRRCGDTYQHKRGESQLITVVLPEREREQWLIQLKHVAKALNQGLYSIRSTYYCRDDIFEIIAAMDDMAIVFVNTTALLDNFRYRVYCPKIMHTCSTLTEVTEVLRPFSDEGKKIRGVGFGNAHYCALFPIDEEPNFAGNNCIGQWD